MESGVKLERTTLDRNVFIYFNRLKGRAGKVDTDRYIDLLDGVCISVIGNDDV